MKRYAILAMLLISLLAFVSAAADGAARLPSDLEVIGKQAFLNADITQVVIPEGTRRIESKAFSGCAIEEITLPQSVEYIAEDAFDDIENIFVRAPQGSYAQEWFSSRGAMSLLTPGVAARTQDEIRAFVNAHPADPDFFNTTTFRREPQGGTYSDGDYVPGLISKESIADGINMLNQVRYIAGLNADVVHDSSREEMMGAMSLVHGLNGGISHYPERPQALSDSRYDELYDMAYQAASSSNLYAGMPNLAYGILGYMAEGMSNFNTVGHRRWILNPSMKKTAFGYYYISKSYCHFSGMYAFDRSGPGRETLVPWPAQQTPVSHFINVSTHPWSFSFNRYLTPEAISVKLVRESDGKTWRFSTEAADGPFAINNRIYGQPGCVIFLPEGLDEVSAGDVFHVQIKDTEYGAAVEYTVNFFEL